MAIRSSRQSNTSSILSKFQTMANQATAYNDAKMANDYNNGLITGTDYLEYLNKRKGSTSANTTAGLGLSKKIKSVETDLKQNKLQTQIDLGEEDPIKMANLLSERVVDEGIIEGTPEYNSILKAVVNLKDQSVNFDKKKKLQEYKEMKVIDPSQADKMWDDYLQTLPDKLSNQIAIQNAQNESENFHTTRIKSELARAINETKTNLEQSGITGSSLHSAMRDAYSEASKIAADNGLMDYANTLDNYAFTSNQNAQNAAETEMNKATTQDIKLANAQTWDISKQIEQAKKSGDLNLLKDLNSQLITSMELEKTLNEKAGKLDQVAAIDAKIPAVNDEIKKLQSTFLVNPDGTISPRENPDGSLDVPQKGDYIMVRDAQGNTTQKTINDISAYDPNNANAPMEFTTENWTKDKNGDWVKNMVVDPRTGFFDVINVDPKTGEEYVQDQAGNNIRVKKDKEGNPIMLGEEIGQGSGVYRMPKADGGYEFTVYEDGKDATKIDAYTASEKANLPVSEVLKGSASKVDQDTISKMGNTIVTPEIRKTMGLQSIVSGLNQKSTGVQTINKLLTGTMETANKQKEAINKATELAKANEPKSVLPNVVNNLGGVTPPEPVSAPIPGNVGTYVSPTEAFAPTPTQVAPPTTQPIAPSNFAVLGKQDVIAPGYIRKRKPDGGFDFVKEGFGNISVEDLARETGTVKAKLLDPNAKSFKLI